MSLDQMLKQRLEARRLASQATEVSNETTEMLRMLEDQGLEERKARFLKSQPRSGQASGNVRLAAVVAETSEATSSATSAPLAPSTPSVSPAIPSGTPSTRWLSCTPADFLELGMCQESLDLSSLSVLDQGKLARMAHAASQPVAGVVDAICRLLVDSGDARGFGPMPEALEFYLLNYGGR